MLLAHDHRNALLRTTSLALVVVGLTSWGCTSSAPSSSAAPKPQANTPLAAEPVARTTRTSTSPADVLAAVHLQLAVEASHRPNGTPSVEVVLKALNAGGVACEPGRQSLAALTEADYCWQSRTIGDAIAFSICEYPSEDAVRHSQEISLTKFAAMGERTFVVQGHTMMTIKAHGPEAAAVITKVKAILAALP